MNIAALPLSAEAKKSNFSSMQLGRTHSYSLTALTFHHYQRARSPRSHPYSSAELAKRIDLAGIDTGEAEHLYTWVLFYFYGSKKSRFASIRVGRIHSYGVIQLDGAHLPSLSESEKSSISSI